MAPPGFGKSRFGRSLGGLFVDPHINNPLTTIQTSPERKLIIIDSFDTLADLSLFNYLKALRDENKYHLAYVFLVNKPFNDPVLGDLLKLTSEHIEYLPVLDPAEYDLFGFNPSPKQFKEIEKLSGGIPILVKACVYSMRDGSPLNVDPFIAQMLASSPQHPSYINSQLIQDYLDNNSPLSASETRLLTLLEAHKGQLVSKDQICEVVYPDVKNRAGITDHAIDQLIHRLRAKVLEKYSIVTHRGLGYRLS
ncbi:MAG: hypothetical protein G01um101416_943 [Microgenomates group bacterium Gr01-1014_16]|nr:MAG: hypothetical protein G01um101416_943 [Microgenomates group bacterium Gr01-1014_16]